MSLSRERVVVAMSGGVDSSVAAALLRDEGHEVIGATLQLGSCDDLTTNNSCCGLGGIDQARAVAGKLGIPHQVLDCRRAFEELVLRPCWTAYASGRTPNPCVLCNQKIKLGWLRDHARSLGARWVATGHYARVAPAGAGSGPAIWRGLDRAKDQSYFLFSLEPGQLVDLILPLGSLRKRAVRELARQRSLPSAELPESQDACLGAGGSGFAELLRQRFKAGSSPGRLVNDRGETVGHHDGIHWFTIGQRRGLGTALGQRAWVRDIDAVTGCVRLTTDARILLSSRFSVRDVRWSPDLGNSGSTDCLVQIRYRHPAAAARVTREGDRRASVVFESPQRAVTPGQAAVFYAGDRIVGGGWIERAADRREGAA